MRQTMATLGLIAALALPFGHLALAAGQGDTRGTMDMFATMDSNKDGVLTADEFVGTPMADDFAKYDRNHDGKVTRQEFDDAAKTDGMSAMPGM
jgi:Ca2+-binding EF-hand superfamily protein